MSKRKRTDVVVEREKHKDAHKKVKVEHKLPSETLTNGGPPTSGSSSQSQTLDKTIALTGNEKKIRDKKRRNEAMDSALSLAWTTSTAVGGRLIDLDPIFSVDEEHILLAYESSIKVYACATSLLVRTLTPRSRSGIAAFALSACDPSHVYIALSTGRIEQWNWAEGKKIAAWDVTSSLFNLRVGKGHGDQELQDILYVSDNTKKGYSITAHSLQRRDLEATAEVKTLLETEDCVSQLQVLGDGELIVAATQNRIMIGTKAGGGAVKHLNSLHYTWREIAISQKITALDARFMAGPSANPTKKAARSKQLDLAVGTAGGEIFCYSNIAKQLEQVQLRKHTSTPSANPLHWHRYALGSVKWSLDGNYLVSGGSETVIVQWQLDTGKRHDLPHVSSAIESIVVSPRGSSYGVRLADNSVMVLSTLDLKPTVNIPGVQLPSLSKEALEARQRKLASTVTGDNSHIMFAVPASASSRTGAKQSSSSPYLQTVDARSGTALQRQALVRTNLTARLMGPEGQIIEEPDVALIRTSHDGKWLATVDEWTPPATNSILECSNATDLDENRQLSETYLKFWSWNESMNTWELVWRVENPHKPERRNFLSCGSILDLAYDPSRSGFFTLGDDGAVKHWQPQIRLRHGVPVADNQGNTLSTWSNWYIGSIALPATSLSIGTITSSLSGHLAVSQDGSVIAVAVDDASSSSMCIMSIGDGSFSQSHGQQRSGAISGLAIMNRHLIVLGDDLIVWDLVDDTLMYSIKLNRGIGLPRYQALLTAHLCIDERNGTFAITTGTWKKEWRPRIAVFTPYSASPIFSTDLTRAVVSIFPSPLYKGFLTVDSLSEIRLLSPNKEQLESAEDLAEETLNPTSFTAVDTVFGKIQGKPLIGSDNLMDRNSDQNMEDGVASAIDQHDLADIWSTKQAMALPPINTMFAQVAALISKSSVKAG